MEAQIRIATRKELPGFFRPFVCLLGDKICYTFKTWREEVCLESGTAGIRPERGADDLTYFLSDGRSLVITSGREGWIFDGERVRELWPTPYQRELVSGRYRFRVKPEDDTLFFECPNAAPDLATVIVGFFIYAFRGDGGISSA